ncbi:hypothetical protein [Pseudomonas sp. UMAB-40]|uniref:hypothetical protein n=1 Tax=Pseudomonas sp. UMAB-40 TaxID=1365407 RepID=UPI001C58DC0F|nr:hypothetical protein [Pseudomonas sp. UMAB-40]
MKYIVALAILAATQFAHASCSVSDIKITAMKAQFVDTCGGTKCSPHMTGVATLENTCAEAVGVQIQITGYDKSGSPVSTDELWPASVRNIPPGSYTFNMSQYLEYDPTIVTFNIKAIDVNRWK